MQPAFAQSPTTPKPAPSPGGHPLHIHLITEAGRPLYHYAEPRTNYAQTNTLSATFAAFSATTSNKVFTISTSSLTFLTISKPPLFLAIVSRNPNHPLNHLRSIARLTLTTVYTCLSASLIQHLTNFPAADTTAITSRFEPLLNRVIASALTYPLCPALSLLPALPAPLDPASHIVLTRAITRALTRFKSVTHVLIFTASSLYPRRIITSISPSNAHLSSLDEFLLLHVPPTNAEDKPITPDLLFPPTCAFHKGFRVALRAVSLQLDLNRLEMMSVLDRGINRQSPLNCMSNSAIWLMALGDWKRDEPFGEQFLNHLEDLLDRSKAARDVIVAMERPWTVSDIKGMEFYYRSVRAILMFRNQRFVGTVEAFGYHIAEAVLRTLEMSHHSFVIHRVNGMLVVVCERMYIVVFADDVSEKDALHLTKQTAVPWMKRFEASLMPVDEGTAVHPMTPLAGFLAPFSS